MVEREKMNSREQESVYFVKEHTSQRYVRHIYIMKSVENAKKKLLGSLLSKLRSP